MILMKNIVIFASGNGTNAQRIAEYFSEKHKVKVQKVYANKPDAYVLTRAKKLNIKTFVFNRNDFFETNIVINELEKDNPDLIVLAGFLWLIPEKIIDKYEGRIINIHPALLPKYGGKGMYGIKVHQAVINNKDKESGITIHYVNKQYDEGEIIFQVKCSIDSEDTPTMLASKIHTLEYEHFPVVIEKLLNN